MNELESLEVINDNLNSSNNSLLYYTHELSVFNKSAFLNYFKAIKSLTKITEEKVELDRNLSSKLIRIYEFFLLQIGYHFDEDDLYKMKNLPKNYSAYTNCLRVAISSYLNGNLISKELENHLMNDLNELD